MKKTTQILLSLMIVSCLFGNRVFASEPKIPDKKMQEMLKMMQPSEAHKKLEPLVGKWTYTVKYWMGPKDKPMVTTGTAENTLVMGGRFLQQAAHGEAQNGQPAFEGDGMTGYDNVKHEYTTFWVDNMSTGMMMGEGTFDDKSKTMNDKGTFSCPMTGEKNRPYRAKWTLENKDAYKYEFYLTDASTDTEFKAIEIAYKRAM